MTTPTQALVARVREARPQHINGGLYVLVLAEDRDSLIALIEPQEWERVKPCDHPEALKHNGWCAACHAIDAARTGGSDVR